VVSLTKIEQGPGIGFLYVTISHFSEERGMGSAIHFAHNTAVQDSQSTGKVSASTLPGKVPQPFSSHVLVFRGEFLG
jgi:hypothetical protein